MLLGHGARASLATLDTPWDGCRDWLVTGCECRPSRRPLWNGDSFRLSEMGRGANEASFGRSAKTATGRTCAGAPRLTGRRTAAAGDTILLAAARPKGFAT